MQWKESFVEIKLYSKISILLFQKTGYWTVSE